ncbi:MAG: amidohydrolase family protein, partial [Bacillota bacterium]
MKTLFTNCKIYNGSGSDAFMGEVLVENDKIIEVSVKCQGESDNIVDLNGLSLSSGFIDCHSHNDWFACRTDSKKFFVPFVEQGITTFVCGNCGLSAMGYEKSSATRDVIGGGLFSVQNTEKDCGNVAEYFDFIDKNTNLNIATLVGHCTARASVAGDRAEITADEQQKMLEILEENLQQGACGISLGLMYVPGIYSNLEELKAVAKLCEKYDKVLTVHPRANSSVSMAYPELLGRSHLLRAMDELVEVTKGLKVKLQYSHAIFVGKNSFKCNDECLEIIENMRKNGVDAMFDIYAEDMGVSVITVILPG